MSAQLGELRVLKHVTARVRHEPSALLATLASSPGPILVAAAPTTLDRRAHSRPQARCARLAAQASRVCDLVDSVEKAGDLVQASVIELPLDGGVGACSHSELSHQIAEDAMGARTLHVSERQLFLDDEGEFGDR